METSLRTERSRFDSQQGQWKDPFSKPPRSDRFWSHLSNGHRRLFSSGKSGRGVKLTTHIYIQPRLRMRGAIPPLPHTSSWCSALLSTGVFTAWCLVKHRNNFTCLLSCPIRSHILQQCEVKEVMKRLVSVFF